jgi:hypothetical protein
VLLGTPMNVGTRAIRITKATANSRRKELWTSRNLKPDFLGHGDVSGIHLRQRRRLPHLPRPQDRRPDVEGGRYGKGQMLLLETPVLARPCRGWTSPSGARRFQRVCRSGSFKALEGKTWNHPVVVGDKLYVRNSLEAGGISICP